MKQNPFLSPRPVALPTQNASTLDYRVIEFRREGRIRFIGDCRLDGAAGAANAAVRVFFRPPQPGRTDEIANRLPEQPVAPDNADMFLTEQGLAAARVPTALTEPCVIDLDGAGVPAPAMSTSVEG